MRSRLLVRLGVLVVGLWAVTSVLHQLIRVLLNLVPGLARASATGSPVSVPALIMAVPGLIAAWLVGRWMDLAGAQLILTTIVGFLVGIAGAFVMVGPAVNAFFRSVTFVTGPTSLLLVYLLQAVVGVALYWLVAWASARIWGASRSSALA
jgi:hypothetical protein